MSAITQNGHARGIEAIEIKDLLHGKTGKKARLSSEEMEKVTQFYAFLREGVFDPHHRDFFSSCTMQDNANSNRIGACSTVEPIQHP